MDFMKIRSGGPSCEDSPFTGQEALVMWRLLKNDSRVLNRLEERGFTSSNWFERLVAFKRSFGKDYCSHR